MRANDRDNPVITRRRLVSLSVIIRRRIRFSVRVSLSFRNYAGIIYPSGRKIRSLVFLSPRKPFRFGESDTSARQIVARETDRFFYPSLLLEARTRAKTCPTARIDFQIRDSSIGLLLALPPSPPSFDACSYEIYFVTENRSKPSTRCARLEESL